MSRKPSEFIIRTIFGILFIIVMVFGLLWHEASYIAIMAIIMALGMNELYKITLGRKLPLQRILAFVTGCLMLCTSLSFCAIESFGIFFPLSVLGLLLIPLSFIFNKEHSKIENIAFIYAGLMYIAFPISLCPFLAINGSEFNGMVTLCLFMIIWCSDVGAYCLGTALGQRAKAHKMCPDISPKKSWWGFAGAVITGIIGAGILHYTLLENIPLVHCLVLGLIVSISAVGGDLVESLWKRRYGVKDSGKAIPGHGGILDRFDSSLAAIPIGGVYLFLMNLL